MSYGRAGKGDEKGMDRLVEEIAEREEGACLHAHLVSAAVYGWVGGWGGRVW